MLWPTLAIPIGALLIMIYTVKDLIREGYQAFFWSKERLMEEDRRSTTDEQLADPETVARYSDRS